LSLWCVGPAVRSFPDLTAQADFAPGLGKNPWIIAAGVGWSLQRAPTYADGTGCINNAPLVALTPSNEPMPRTTVDCQISTKENAAAAPSYLSRQDLSLSVSRVDLRDAWGSPGHRAGVRLSGIAGLRAGAAPPPWSRSSSWAVPSALPTPVRFIPTYPLGSKRWLAPLVQKF
jgi:hypothetical protein